MLVGIVRLILLTINDRSRETKISRKNVLVEIVRVVTCRSRVVKIKEHLSIGIEFSTRCTEDRVFVDCVF